MSERLESSDALTPFDHFIEDGPSAEAYLTPRIYRRTSAATPHPTARELREIKLALVKGRRIRVFTDKQLALLGEAMDAKHGRDWRRA